MIRRLNFARYAHEIAPTAVDQLASHARKIVIGKVRKHNNRANKHEQYGQLGIHCFCPSRSRPNVQCKNYSKAKQWAVNDLSKDSNDKRVRLALPA